MGGGLLLHGMGGVMANKQVSDGDLTRLAMAPHRGHGCTCILCTLAKLAQECITSRREKREALKAMQPIAELYEKGGKE